MVGQTASSQANAPLYTDALIAQLRVHAKRGHVVLQVHANSFCLCKSYRLHWKRFHNTNVRRTAKSRPNAPL